MPASLLLMITLALPAQWLEPGAWLPTAGRAGDRPVAALGEGGDGRIYAATGGSLYFAQPGQAWKRIGPYAPQIRWSGDQSLEADGPFPRDLLERVARDAGRAIESAGGFVLIEGTISEEVVEDLLQSYVEELEPDPDSAYAVAGVVSAPGGVWLGTGVGLFFASDQGVRGPVAGIETVLGLAAAGDAVVVTTPDGIFRVTPDTRVQSLAPDRGITRIAAFRGGVVWSVADTLVVAQDGRPTRRLSVPTGRAIALSARSEGDTVWVATRRSLYRWSSVSGWFLCPQEFSQPPVRLHAVEAGLIAVLEDRILVIDAECSRPRVQRQPWPGTARFVDVATVNDELWAATSEGAYQLGPPDPDADRVLRDAAFRRAVEALPTLEQTVRDALWYHGIERAQDGYGLRPVYRYLVPDLTGLMHIRADRTDRDPSFGVGARQLTTIPPRYTYRVMLLWNMRFDVFTVLLDAEQSEAVGALPGSDGEEGEVEVISDDVSQLVDEAEVDDVSDELASDFADEDEPESDFESVVLTVGEDGDFVDLDDEQNVALARLAAERRRSHRDRQALQAQVIRLYRDRLTAMRKLWQGRGDSPVELVLAVDELDGQLDALTGGRFGERSGRRR